MQYAVNSVLRPPSATRVRTTATAPVASLPPSPPPQQLPSLPPQPRTSSEPWFGPSSNAIGRPERPSSGWLRPSSAIGGAARPMSARSNGGIPVPVVSPTPRSPRSPSPDRTTIEGRVAALTGTTGTGHVRGETLTKQWARMRPMSTTGGGAVARPSSAPRSSFGGSRASYTAVTVTTPFASNGGAAAATTAMKLRRRMSGTSAMEGSGTSGGGSRTSVPWRPHSALPYSGSSTAGGGGAAAAVVLGRSGSFSPTISAAYPLQPDSPPGGVPPRPPRPLSPSRSHWVPMRSGGGSAVSATTDPLSVIGGASAGGGALPPRPSSGVPVQLASTGAVVMAATMAEAVGQPPVPYRSRHEFLQSGKRIPTVRVPGRAPKTKACGAIAVSSLLLQL